MKKTKKNYETYLNELGYEGTEQMIIGGKMRLGKFGTMTRKHDPIAFEVGYREWSMGY